MKVPSWLRNHCWNTKFQNKVLSGPINGLLVTNFLVFKRIPYAASPVLALEWHLSKLNELVSLFLKQFIIASWNDYSWYLTSWLSMLHYSYLVLFHFVTWMFCAFFPDASINDQTYVGMLASEPCSTINSTSREENPRQTRGKPRPNYQSMTISSHTTQQTTS